MKAKSPHSLRKRPFKARAQRGVVLLFAMIALLILMIGSVALVRSFNSSLFNAGNIAFKKDLQNQSERAVAQVMTALQSGGALATEAARGANSLANNYSAAMLTVNNQGIPLALLTDSAFTTAGFTGADIAPSGQGVTIRYVVDRLCSATGAAASLGAGGCVLADSSVPTGGSADALKRAENTGTGSSAVPQQVVYRLSVRVIGPRRTQAYYQSTFSL